MAYKDPEDKRLWYQRNKARIRAKVQLRKTTEPALKEAYKGYSSTWYAKPGVKATQRGRCKAWYIKNAYGLTLGQYESKRSEQDNCCGICGYSPGTEPPHKLQLVLDHDHTTGKVRKFLCQPCNKGLGHFSDRPELLGLAQKYLLENSK